MNKLEINGETVRVQVKTNPRAKKTVRIDFESPSQLTVLIPEDIEIDVEKLLEKNLELIERKYKELMNKIPILDDSGILYKGERYRLEPHLVDSFDDEKIVTKDDFIHVYHHHERPILKVLEKWMSQKTLELIKQVQAEYPGLRDPTRISVTDTTRWGYTHDNRVIIYNWQLAALPKELARYVIIHELVHLDYMNHQNGFKAKLANYTPNIKKHEKQLKKYQQIKPDKSID